MYDCLQDSQKTITSISEYLTSVMSAAVAGKRSFAELVNATDARKPTSVPANSKGDPKKTLQQVVNTRV